MKTLTKKILLTTGVLSALGIGGAAIAANSHHGSHGMHGPRGEIMQGMMFWALDRDEDGYVDMAEVDKFRTALFTQIDPNNDGEITKAELEEQRQGRGRHGRHGKHMFERADANDDDVVTLEEFLDLEPRMFTRADADEDGRVSVAEAEQLRETWRDWRKSHRQWHRDNNPRDEPENNTDGGANE